MTTLKGRKALDALMDGETLFRVQEPNTLFKMCGLKLKIRDIHGKTEWHSYAAELNWIIEQTFEKYEFIPKVGDFVEATNDSDSTYRGEITRIEDNKVYGLWGAQESATWVKMPTFKFRLLSVEEIDKHEIDRAFRIAGRNTYLYEVGDIVKYHKRFAEVVGEYRKATGSDLTQMLIIRFVVDDRDGNEQMMQREVREDEVTPKCFNTNVIKLRKEEERIW